MDILRAMGANIRIYGNNVIVSYGKLKGINADLADCIDLLPTVAMLASLAKGRTELIGIQRARIKESNRVAAIRECLVKLGNTIIEDENRLVITGNDFFKVITEEDVGDTEEEEEAAAKEKSTRLEGPVTLNSYGDHRIAMALGILGAVTGDIIIDNAECVTKTFPTFWDEFQKVGGQVQIE